MSIPKHRVVSVAYRTFDKSARVRFRRRKTYSKKPGDRFQIDLADLVNISSHNDGCRYLLTCIDVFTKRAWAVPTKTKTGREVSRAFEKILSDGYKPNMVQSDKGTEFLNSTFQSMLKQHNIKFYTSANEDIKAAVVERFNRTLKTKMYRYFTARNTRRYVDVLPDLLHSYNHTYHRSIGMAPVEVDDTNEHLVRARLYPQKRNLTSGSMTLATECVSRCDVSRSKRDISVDGLKRFS